MKPEQEKLYKELKQSGKSIAEFSRERNIPLHRLYELSSTAKRGSVASGKFVRVGAGKTIKIHVSESIYLEVSVESVREVLSTLGVSL